MAKLSYYNIHTKGANGEGVLYNSLYGNILQLSAEEYAEYLKMESTGIFNISLIDSLAEYNFLVDDDFDELEYYKLLWYRSLYASGILRHTILPNLSCNCDCPDCFEEKNGTLMTKQTAQDYIRWLEPQLENVKQFYVSWFGGEPLLSKELIGFISSEIIHLSQKYNFEYSACIVSNGVLLDRAFIDRMYDLNIKSVQITLDGDKEVHDRYRFLKGTHNGTFDIILKNLEEYCKYTDSDVASTLRVNVTDENYDSIPGLLDRIPNSIKLRCMLSFRWVYSHSYGRNPGIEFSAIKKGNAPFENLAYLYKLAQQKGFTTNTFDEGLHCNFCECDFDRAFQIDQDGDIFMCTHSMDKNEIIGNVREGFGSQKDLTRYAKFINANPFNDPECQTCKILPICKGGCRKARYLGKKVCTDVKYSIPAYILEKAHIL